MGRPSLRASSLCRAGTQELVEHELLSMQAELTAADVSSTADIIKVDGRPMHQSLRTSSLCRSGSQDKWLSMEADLKAFIDGTAVDTCTVRRLMDCGHLGMIAVMA